MRVFAVDVLGYRLVDAEWQYHLVVILALLDTFLKPFLVGKRLLGQLRRRKVVSGNGQLLVARVLIEVVLAQVGLPLGSYHALHQLHGGVVLTAVAAALGFDGHFAELLCPVEPLRRIRIHISIELCLGGQAQQ